MNPIEYGILCTLDDEKTLVKKVNAFLAERDYRKMSKRVPTGVRDPDDAENEPRYAHFHYQFLKQQPRWYFDLYPNVDLDGRARFPEHLDAGWTLYVTFPHAELNNETENAELAQFVSDLVAHVGFPTRVLHRYTSNENRR